MAQVLTKKRKGAPRAAKVPPAAGVDALPGVQTRIGIELDGTQCRAVAVADGAVKSWRVFDGLDTADALRRWLKDTRIGDAHVQIAWSGPHLEFRRLRTNDDVPLSERRGALIEMAEREMTATAEGEDAASTAGLFYPPEAGQPGNPVALVGIPNADLAPLWEIVQTHPWSIVPSILVPQADGVHVALRLSCAACYVVEDGQVRTYTELQAGGLDALTSKLRAAGGDGDIVNIDELSSGNASGALQAPLQGYLQHIVQETSRWLTSWVNSKLVGRPGEMWVHGPGSQLPYLVGGLAAALGYNINPTGAEQAGNPPPGIATTSNIPEADARQAYVACRAAVAPVSALAVIDNPVLIEQKIRAVERAHKLKAAAAVAVAVLVVVVALAAPLLLAWRTKMAASANLASAQNKLAGLQTDYNTYLIANQGATAKRQAIGADPSIKYVFNILAKTAPPGALPMKGLTMQVAASKMKVAAPESVRAATPFYSVAAWLAALKKAGAIDPQTSSFTFSRGVEHFALTFELPLHPPVKKG